MNIGYIGAGIMGQPMAGNLIKAGHNLFVHNRTPDKCDVLVKQGATFCNSPAETAKEVEVVFINVPDTCDVEQVLFGESGVDESARPGLVVVDNSTISPSSTRLFAERLKDTKGTDYLDAPVSGGDIGAQKGTLAIMVGGQEDVFNKCLPLFEVLGSKVVHVGPVGSGQVCKACNQLFCAINMLACCEGITLARKAGLDPKTMVEVVSSGAGGSWALSNLGSKIVNSDYEPGFMVDLIAKDLRLVCELAEQSKMPLPGLSLAKQLFTATQVAGLGRKGTQAMAAIIVVPEKFVSI